MLRLGVVVRGVVERQRCVEDVGNVRVVAHVAPAVVLDVLWRVEVARVLVVPQAPAVDDTGARRSFY